MTKANDDKVQAVLDKASELSGRLQDTVKELVEVLESRQVP